ncbi:MAG TPA: CotH kinase family protein, partial [Myxococcota bacterium]|nr:CotH kinase family protein [Myxococcota bacterium]
MFWLCTALAAPLADHARGLYDQPFEVQVTGDGGSLFYSTDLSVPTRPVSGPIPIRTTTVLRLAEVAQDGSRVETTHSYIFVSDVMASSVMDQAVVQNPAYTASIERALRDLPTISLVNPDGIPLSEVPISLEWIDPNGDQLQVGAGAYVSGGTSWAYEKTSFRLVFRDEYGPGHLEADIYGPDATGIPAVERFDVLSLRGGNHDTVFYQGARGQHLRNLWMDETQLDQGQLAPHGRFANVYRNGVYHGLYHVRERFNAAMMSEYLGGSEEDYEAINAGSAYDGSGATWAALVAASNSFEEARRYLDVDDYLDYMVLNYYAGNAWDWYSWHNWQAAGPARPDAGGFRFHSSDSDICLSYTWDVNILSLGGPSDIFLGLNRQEDPDFQVALADAIYRNL